MSLTTRAGATLLFGVLVAVLYGQTLAFEFVWDDESLHFVEENRSVLDPTSLADWMSPWTGDQGLLYTPLLYNFWAGVGKTSQLVGARLPGEPMRPAPYHAANVVIHWLNTVLVFLLIRGLLQHDLAALLGGLFFALHPVQVESVAWISQMRGLLASSLGLLALLLYQHQRPRLYWPATLAFALSLLSKPSMVVLPLIVLAIQLLRHAEVPRKALVRLLPWFALAAGFTLLTKLLQPDSMISAVLPLWARPLQIADSYNFYLAKVLFPLKLAASYDRSIPYLSSQWWFVLSPLVPLGLVQLASRYRERLADYSPGIAIFTLGILPVSGLIPFTYQGYSTVADRYLYFPLAGAAFCFACLYRKLESRRLTLPISCAVIAALFLLSLARVPAWSSELAVWNDVLARYPSSSLAFTNRGHARYAAGSYGEAIDDFSRALEQNPLLEELYLSRGRANLRAGQIEPALSDIAKAIQIDPHDAAVYFARSEVQAAAGSPEEALEDLDRVLDLDPEHFAAWASGGELLLESKSYGRAIAFFDRAIELRPDTPELYNNRGLAHLWKKQPKPALRDFDTALELRPAFAQARLSRGLLLYRMKQHSRARVDLAAARELGLEPPPGIAKALRIQSPDARSRSSDGS